MPDKANSKINMYINKLIDYPENPYQKPILVLRGEDDYEAYLMPVQFRSIQICGSPDGTYKMGSSSNIGLGHIAELSHKKSEYDTCGYDPYSTSEEIAMDLIWGLACQAMLDFFSNKYGSKFNFVRVYDDQRTILEWTSRVINYAIFIELMELIQNVNKNKMRIICVCLIG